MNKIIKRSVENPTDFIELIFTPMIQTGFKGVETFHVTENLKLSIITIRFLGIQDEKLAQKVIKSIRIAIDLWNQLIESQKKISKIVCGCATNHFPYEEENVQSRRAGTKKVSRRRKEA